MVTNQDHEANSGVWRRLADEGVLKKPLHVQFVMGVKNAMPVIRQAFDFMVDEVTRLAPDTMAPNPTPGKM